MKIKLLLTLTIFFCLAALETFGQVGQGVFVSGRLGLETEGGKRTSKIGSVTTESDLPQPTNFSVAPIIGYFFTDNLGAGLILSYNSGSKVEKTTNTTTTRSTSEFFAGLFGRYAKQMGSSDFYLTGDLVFGLGTASGSVKEERGNTSVTVDAPTATTISIDLAPSILYFPTPKIGLEAGLGSLVGFSNTSVTEKSGNNEITESYNRFKLLSLNALQFNFGLSYYFNR